MIQLKKRKRVSIKKNFKDFNTLTPITDLNIIFQVTKVSYEVFNELIKFIDDNNFEINNVKLKFYPVKNLHHDCFFLNLKIINLDKLSEDNFHRIIKFLNYVHKISQEINMSNVKALSDKQQDNQKNITIKIRDIQLQTEYLHSQTITKLMKLRF